MRTYENREESVLMLTWTIIPDPEDPERERTIVHHLEQGARLTYDETQPNGQEITDLCTTDPNMVWVS